MALGFPRFSWILLRDRREVYDKKPPLIHHTSGVINIIFHSLSRNSINYRGINSKQNISLVFISATRVSADLYGYIQHSARCLVFKSPQFFKLRESLSPRLPRNKGLQVMNTFITCYDWSWNGGHISWDCFTIGRSMFSFLDRKY